MPTQCSPQPLGFAPVEGRAVVAAFDGGAVTSDAGALLLGAADRAIRLVERFAACFHDDRAADRVEHSVARLVGQRIFGLALGYEDLIDHDQLRHDPILAVLAGRLAARRSGCAPLAGKSTLNRLEHAPAAGPTRYHKIGHDPAAIERLLVELFLEAHATAPKRIVLDLDATDDPLHGHQEGRFFHGYYDCYCYLPLYVFCGRHLLAAKLRRSNIDASAGAVEEVERLVTRIRARWPRVRILLRGDSGFARAALMAWCERHRVDSLFGLARNDRLVERIAAELAWAEDESAATGGPARRLADFLWSTRERAGAAGGGSSPRRNGPAAVPIPVSSSPRCGDATSTPGGSMRRSTAPAARRRTGSRSASSICSPTAPRPRLCGPTSSGCGSPRWPTCCCARCAASGSPTRSSPGPPAAPSA
jgi:hypothetical protein